MTTTRCDLAASNAGRVVLWIGNEAKGWSLAQFAHAAAFARTLGVDTLSPKLSNGSEKWYGTAANLRAIRQTVLNEGCGLLPFGYGYGTVQADAPPLIEMLTVNGSCMADLEAEINGDVAYADQLAQWLRHDPQYLFYLTSWANPDGQNWDQVLKILEPVIDAYVPQQYNDYLASREFEIERLGETCIQVGIDLTQEFGANHQPAIVAQAAADSNKTIWLWEYQVALAQPELVRQLVAIMHGAPTPPPPLPRTYLVRPGDSLSGIAAHLGLGNWYQDLYKPNMATIEAAARAHGLPDSNNGNEIFAGTVLRY